MNRFLKNSLFSTADIAIVLALSLIATPVLIAQLGVSLYGVFVFLSIFSVYGMLSFFDLGMEGALTTHVARLDSTAESGKINSILTIGILYYAAIGISIAVLIYLFEEFLIVRFELTTMVHEQVLSAIRYVALNVALQFVTTPIVAALQGMQKFVSTRSANSVLNIIQYTLLIFVAAPTKRIDYAFLLILAITSIRFLVYAMLYFNLSISRAKIVLTSSLFGNLWYSSSSLFINRLVGLFYNQTGKFLIWGQLPIANIAVFDVVNRPSNLVRVISSTVYSAVIPEASRLTHSGDLTALKNLYIKLVRFAYILVMPPIVAIFVNAPRILDTWIGHNFGQYGYLVQIVMIAAIFNPLAAVASTVVVGMDKVRQTVWISVAGTVINVVLGVILILHVGLYGLFISFLIAEIFISVLYFSAMNTILSIINREWYRHIFFTIILAVAVSGMHYVMFPSDLATPHWVVGTCLLVATHYVLQVFFLLGEDERKQIVNQFSRF